MPGRLIFAAILTALATFASASCAQADEWCGYAAHANAMIECGYSSVTECTSMIGAGATCFVDPDLAADTQRGSLEKPATTISRKPNDGYESGKS